MDLEAGSARFVVPALNAAGTLGPCLDSILVQSGVVPGDVIVVDNGSKDGTCAVAAARGVRLLECERRGAGAARNVALRAIAERPARYLVFVDADVELPVGWLAAAVDALQEHGDRAAGVGGPGRSGGPTAVEQLLDTALWGWDRFGGGSHTVSSLATMDTVYRYRAVAGREFAEELAAGEDPDWCFGLREQGWELWMVPELQVAHRHVDTTGSMLKKWFWYGTFYLPPYLRHPREVTPNVVLRVMAAPGFVAGWMLVRRLRGGRVLGPAWAATGLVAPYFVMLWRFRRLRGGSGPSPALLAAIALARLGAHAMGILLGPVTQPALMWRSLRKGLRTQVPGGAQSARDGGGAS